MDVQTGRAALQAPETGEPGARHWLKIPCCVTLASSLSLGCPTKRRSHQYNISNFCPGSEVHELDIFLVFSILEIGKLRSTWEELIFSLSLPAGRRQECPQPQANSSPGTIPYGLEPSPVIDRSLASRVPEAPRPSSAPGVPASLVKDNPGVYTSPEREGAIEWQLQARPASSAYAVTLKYSLPPGHHSRV